LYPDAQGYTVDQRKTLSEALRGGPLPLGYALHCAQDIATSLRELHEGGRIHGSVNTGAVLLNSEGAELLAPKNRQARAEPAVDISAFGAVFYEMVTGVRPSPVRAPAAPLVPSRSSEEALYAAVVRLAHRCIGSISNSPTEMQNVLSEILMLSMQTKLAGMEDSILTAPARQESVQDFAPSGRPASPISPKSSSGEPAVSASIAARRFLAGDDPGFADPGPSGIRCPKCGGPYVYHSRPRSWFESICVAWKTPPLRCHRCLHRYLTIFGKFHIEKGSPRPEKAWL